MPKQVLMYTRTFCPFCTHAKELMQSKGVAYDEINIDHEPQRRQEMIEKAEGRHTVPQVFVDGTGLGGFTDIYTLDREGKLDEILGL